MAPRVRRGLVAAMICLVLVPAAAFGHAAYKDSDPKDESTLASPPTSVWAEYTEPLQEGSNLEVYDPCGTRVDGGDTSITAYRMEVSMAADTAGVYSVRWVAASAVDPHVTRGTFTFSVTGGDTCPESTAADDEEDEQAGTRRARSDRTSVAAATESSDTTRRSGRIRTARQERGDENGRSGGSVQDGAAVDEAGLDVAQDADSGEEERGVWDGIPLDGFSIALAIAAAIGAAGGRIYANIMGPRR